MKTIDPRTTRRRVEFDSYERNSAMYATYRVIRHEYSPTLERVTHVILQKKDEFCQPKEQK